MKLVVGLGNPGGQYAKTYHNIGYITIDRLVKSLGGEFNKTKCKRKGCSLVISTCMEWAKRLF